MTTVFVVPAEGLDVPNIDAGDGVYFAPGGETVDLTDYVQRRIDDGTLIVSEPAGPHFTDIVIGDLGTLSNDVITVAAGQGALIAGTVMGQSSADDKWYVSPETASDGTDTAAAILLFPVDTETSEGDVETTALTNFAEVRAARLTWDATVDDAPKKAAKAAQLRAAGIKVRSDG